MLRLWGEAMKLPPGNLERIVDTSNRYGFVHLAIAYRHDKLWVYATSTRHAVRTEIEVTHEEIEELGALMSVRNIKPEKAALLVPVDVYKQLRRFKQPVAIHCEGGSWTISPRGASVSFHVALDIDSKMVDCIEQVFSMEFDRPELGTLSVDAKALEECREGIGQQDIGATMSIPVNVAKRPMILRQGANIACLMPLTMSNTPGIDKLVEAAKEALDAENLPGSTSDLARLILSTFGVTHAESSVTEENGQ